MKSKFLFLLIVIGLTNNLAGQSEPIWDIGTKWTFEFDPVIAPYIGYLENEIIDTVTMDGKKLYVVSSYPSNSYSGIKYFYYEANLVYNYNPENKVLQKLYDFSATENYLTKYHPACDPTFDIDSMEYQRYTVHLDSTSIYEMPDGSFRNSQFVHVKDTIMINDDTLIMEGPSRVIVEGIGFMSGTLQKTHDWALGYWTCDPVISFAGQLRCFENDSIFYNFTDFPCDQIEWESSTQDELFEKSIFPNPTYKYVQIENNYDKLQYQIYSMEGRLIGSGEIQGDEKIEIKHTGLQILRLQTNNKNICQRIMKLD